jgi:K+ transporter
MKAPAALLRNLKHNWHCTNATFCFMVIVEDKPYVTKKSAD